MNASILLGYTEATRRRPHGFERWSRPGPFPRSRFGAFPRHSVRTLLPVVMTHPTPSVPTLEPVLVAVRRSAARLPGTIPSAPRPRWSRGGIWKRIPVAIILVPAHTRPPAGFSCRNYFPVENRAHSACSQVAFETLIHQTFAEPCILRPNRSSQAAHRHQTRGPHDGGRAYQ